jgi:DnaJ-class molecular chaperone
VVLDDDDDGRCVQCSARQIVIKSPPGLVTPPSSLRVVEGEGMPVFEDPSRKGRLFIRITVDFPAELELRCGLPLNVQPFQPKRSSARVLLSFTALFAARPMNKS